MRRRPHAIPPQAEQWCTGVVRNIHAGSSATHSNGASLGGKTSLMARGARAEGPQNEKRPFSAAEEPVAGCLRNGVMQFARQDWRAANRLTLTPF